MENLNFEFKSVICKEENGYSSLCIDIDVASQGDSVIEPKEMLIEEVNDYVELCIETNLPIIRKVPDGENPLLTDKKSVVEKLKTKYL